MTGQKPSTVVEENCRLLVEREIAGRAEHGGDLDRTDLTPTRWLEELRAEQLDSANYAAKLLSEIPRLEAASDLLADLGYRWDGSRWLWKGVELHNKAADCLMCGGGDVFCQYCMEKVIRE